MHRHDHLIALVPAEAAVGDVVVRFWKCDAALVLRELADRGWWGVVGRTDVAVGNTIKEGDADADADADAKQLCVEPREEPAKGPVWVDLDLRVLQLLTEGATGYDT